MSHPYLSYRQDRAQPLGALYQTPKGEFPLENVMFSLKKLEHINCIQQPTQYEGGLYLGDIITIVKPDIIQTHGITAILSCLAETNYSSNLPSHITRKVITAKDTLDYPLNIHFEESFDFINSMRKMNKNVLVHCHAGVSRSAAILCAYLMRKKDWSAGQAVQFLKQKRNRVKPNQNFMKLLHEFQARGLTKGYLESRSQRSSVNEQKSQFRNSFVLQRNSFDFRPQRRFFGTIQNEINNRDSRSINKSSDKMASFQCSTPSIRYSMRMQPERGGIETQKNKKNNHLKIKKEQNDQPKENVSFGAQFKNKISALLGRKTRIPWQLSEKNNIDFEDSKFSINCM